MKVMCLPFEKSPMIGDAWTPNGVSTQVTLSDDVNRRSAALDIETAENRESAPRSEALLADFMVVSYGFSWMWRARIVGCAASEGEVPTKLVQTFSFRNNRRGPPTAPAYLRCRGRQWRLRPRCARPIDLGANGHAGGGFAGETPGCAADPEKHAQPAIDRGR